MTMPNFLIIGAPKSGTTVLYHYLRQHPQIFMSATKEPSFFGLEGEKLDFRAPDGTPSDVNSYGINNIEAYRRLFDGVKDKKAVGEASTMYLGSPKAPERIRYYIPHAKLVAILRDPVERAYAGFLMARRIGYEPLSDFADALQDQERRKKIKHFGGVYLEPGFYHLYLTRYFQFFSKENIRVYLHEDFMADPRALVEDIFSFLGVDDTFVPDMSIRENVSGLPKIKVLHNLLTRRGNPLVPYIAPRLPLRVRRYVINLKNWNLVKPPLSPALRKKLIEVYREEILKLQGLINRDLSKWLE